MKRPSNNSPAIETLRSCVGSLWGDVAEKIVRRLLQKPETDDTISKTLKLPVKLVRRTIYLLEDAGVIKCSKTISRAEQRVVYWSTNEEMLRVAIVKHYGVMLQKLKAQLERERETLFFACENKHKVDIDVATEYNFKCSVCGKRLALFDNTGIVRALENKVKAIEQTLKSLV